MVATLSGGRWKVRHIGGNVTHAGWEINWISVVAAGDRRVCAAWGHYARSGNYSACSFDDGSTWEDAKPIVETYPVGKDRAYVPALLYEPQTESVLAVQLYDQGGEPLTLYPVYSYRHLDRDYWVPDMAGRDDRHQPPLRVFNQGAGTNRAQPPQGLRVAYSGTGLATLVWVERIGDEIEVYVGHVNPAALLSRSRG